jgi:hypothetical protein
MDDSKINQYVEGMSLLENPTTYNLSESKFSVGFAILNMIDMKFIPRNELIQLLLPLTHLGTILDEKVIRNATHPCSASSGDFEFINLNANVGETQQKELIDASMCFDITEATLK